MGAMSNSALTGQNMRSSARASGTSCVRSLNWIVLEAVTLMLMESPILERAPRSDGVSYFLRPLGSLPDTPDELLERHA